MLNLFRPKDITELIRREREKQRRDDLKEFDGLFTTQEKRLEREWSLKLQLKNSHIQTLEKRLAEMESRDKYVRNLEVEIRGQEKLLHHRAFEVRRQLRLFQDTTNRAIGNVSGVLDALDNTGE
jgi:hypothetical protein